MKIKVNLFCWIICIVLFIPLTTFPQGSGSIDYNNIFSLRHNRVGVPQDNLLRIYSLRHGNWNVTDSISLPHPYVALDGNIRRVYILLENMMLFHGFNGEANDSLHFDANTPHPKPDNWIRTPYSTETDFWVYDNEREVGMLKDGEEWYYVDMHDRRAASAETQSLPPLLTKPEINSVEKLYSFGYNMDVHLAAVHLEKITFHNYQLETDFTKAMKNEFVRRYGYPYPALEELEFKLADDVLTAFIYDQQYIAAVYTDKIRFYRYDFSRRQWEQDPALPDLTL